MKGEIRENVSLSWREMYDWGLDGAAEWVQRAKLAPNVTMYERKKRNAKTPSSD
jgi:hypothetical protein